MVVGQEIHEKTTLTEQAEGGMVSISFNVDEKDIPEGFKMDFFNTGTGITGNLQKFIVPRGGIYKISASGARGGNVGGNLGGNGAFVSGEFNLDEGDIIHLLVGHMGLDKPFSDYGGGGGGGSFAVKQDNDSSYMFKPLNISVTPLVIAGGGGGAGDDGGNFSGGAGNGETTGNGEGGTGLQGTNNSGGSGFIGDAKPSNAQSPLSFLNGGTGGTRGSYWGGFGGGGLPYDAGGGGGGYTGGNGGEGVRGGFGGSSYNSGHNQVRQSGVNNGHGKIEITFIKPSPKITAGIEPTIVHAENVKLDFTLDDPEDLLMNYQVLINDIQKEPSSGSSELVRSPFHGSYMISNLDLIIGKNIITLVAINTAGVKSTKKIEIVKQNSNPLITEEVIEGSYLRAKITDEDNDKVRYKIVFNGKQLFPYREFTKLIDTPVSIEYSIPKTLIKIGQPNTVLIEAMDSVGTLSTKEFTATMSYVGMMFTTKEGEFYSTDLGEVLKYLDMGRVLAGSEPVIYEVFLKNTTGIPMKRPTLWIDQRDLNPASEKIELSKTKEPFELSEKIIFGEDYVMAHNQSIPFYVRVKTTEDAVGGGKFDIWVSADPL
ncbi:Glycine rich protein [Brevibacillus laterosporus]|nr:Glycine rich protein [Brevibacillus laterosporus]